MEKNRFYSTYTYLDFDGNKFYTAICLPDVNGTYPTVIIRSPYNDGERNLNDEELAKKKLNDYNKWLENGFAVVFQYCRGSDRNSGDFTYAYIYEREDGLAFQNWVRHQPFYNGEIFLVGRSYTATVHLVTAPFAEDIKGAVLEAQDCERYNIYYRNGFFKSGLHGKWFSGMYKNKTLEKRNYVPESFNLLPLSDYSKTVFNEECEYLDNIFKHPNRDDPFWATHDGGAESRDALKNANIPILLVTGFYDLYTGGIFDMWNGLDEKTKNKSALVVHPFDHAGITGEHQPVNFENGVIGEQFPDYQLNWIKSIKEKSKPIFERGKITYYKLFDNKWCCDDFKSNDNIKFYLGNGEKTYRYNPYAPASFRGGLSCNFGANAWQNKPNIRYDIISVYTDDFEKDTFVKGKITAKLKVKSSCEDTCFYMRLSLCKNEGDYGLRDDINQISNFDTNYIPGECLDMEFSFDEHAFIIKKGEKLRIDISSSAFPFYVRHTNNRGLYSEQTTAKIADNTIVLDKSFIEIPIVI